MKDKFKKSLIILTILLLLISTVIFYESIPKNKVNIFVPVKISASKVADILKDNRLILDKKIFLFFLHLTRSQLKIRSGSYDVSFSLTGIPIIYQLRRGSKGIKVTIPEGFNVEQIADRLYANGIIKDPISLITYVKSNKLEGFLFPETYYFEPGQSVESICNIMVKQFYSRYNPEFTARAYELNFSTYQVIILASIVEKEAKSFEEKRLVAGVFHNRLQKGWPLEACSTVRYALKKYKEPLTYKDTKINSPYNTYTIKGLPAGPICNPGFDSIKAVLFYKETDAMFFFTSDNETHQFSKYYHKHLELQNKNK